MTFRERVLEIVRAIPEGETMTYGQVAELAGSPNAYRAVGSIMKHNYDPTIPCHRVIKADGTLGQYNRGAERKAKLLKQEGVTMDMYER
ncbi:MAG TPA: MGMT family protein [Candidatus Andersenbacteria bacterium]|nr:MGMT family protein [Candidatus Andersenbacteria bacterium]